MKFLIKVKRKHINEGLPRNQKCCPIALAIKEQTVINDAHVGSDKLSFGFWGGQTPLSRSAKRFIKKFDKGEKVKPFNFILKT